MSPSIVQLKSLAYNIFPKGVPDNSYSYQSTPEYQNLIRVIENKSDNAAKLIILANEMVNSFQEYTFDDFSSILKHDRCVKGRFNSKVPKNNSLIIFISLIIPHYLILEVPRSVKVKSISEMNISKTYSQKLTEENKTFYDALNIKINKYFPEYYPFNNDFLDIEVPDIVFDGMGRLSTFSSSSHLNYMTFFNVFFSSNYIIA